jgi:cytoskeletal protein CcmA (bactofilin family)
LNESTTKSVIMADTVIEGDVIAKGKVTVNGRVQGNLSAQSVEISQSGGIYGSLRAQSAEVHGAIQGDVSILGLIRIGETGSVNGKVEYGKIAMEQGGTLSATLRNVPPHLAGDLQLNVDRGGSVRITTLDLTAFDPDDTAEDLTYTVTNPSNGFVALASARTASISKFTQADLESGRILFVHDGAQAPTAGFDTIVSDAKGATSGKVQHVNVSVKD